MDPAVRSLFHELADLPYAEREKVFTEQGISADLRAEVESLLRFDSPEDHANMHWGNYRAIRLIGGGGMGTVYLAERTDGEIIHKAAIKVLRTDVQRPVWREKFLKERQLLAYLNHPSIVHLMDAGHTDDGQPYLVMEYVDGVPIDEFTANMELRDRLSLFLRVCDGVAHAHHRLIIHCDLKPSNILVDRAGQPKLLDFGIGKLIGDQRDRTQTVERLLTPSYASPEQLQGRAETAATDVYSLGAVLHKVLTEHLPDEDKELKTFLPRDIEFILRKALRAEPDERYVSVEAFVNDIRAFMEWRPVEARSADAWYRTRKFIRRYWVPVLTAVLLVAALSAGLYAVNRERALAQRRFSQLRQLSDKVLALDATIRMLPGSTGARNEIVAMSKDYLEGLMTEGKTDHDLGLEVASALLRLAEVQGVPTITNLGQPAEAEQSLAKANALMEDILNKTPGDRKALLLSAQINHDRMILASSDHRREAALALARTCVDRLDLLLKDGATDGENRVAGQIFSNVALTYKNLRSYGDAVRYARRSLDVSRHIENAPSNVANSLSIIADALRNSGDLDGALKTIKEAEAAVRNFKADNETARVSTLNNVLWREGMILGADGQISLMRTDEAIAVLREELNLIEDAARRDPNDARSRILFQECGRELGNILSHRDPAAALAVFDLALSRLAEVKNNSKALRGEAQLLAASAYSLRRLGRANEARKRIDRAFELLQQTKVYPAPVIEAEDETYSVVRAFGDHLAETGESRHASDVYRDLLEKVLASHPDPDNDLRHATTLSGLYEAIARTDLNVGESQQTPNAAGLRLKIWQHWNQKLPNNAFILQQLAAASNT
jgi:serine/threonine protein kinase